MPKRKPESLELLGGPYVPPVFLVGDALPCEYRGRRVVVGGVTDSLIPWPYVHRGGARSLVVCGGLVQAVRDEAAAAVSHHWGVGLGVVTAWRRALGVDFSNNRGSKRLRDGAIAKGRAASRSPESRAKMSATKTGVPAHPNVRAALLRTAVAPRSALWKKRRSENQARAIAEGTALPPTPSAGRPLAPEEVALLGTDVDRTVAAALGRPRSRVCLERRARQIPPFRRPPRPAAEVAARLAPEPVPPPSSVAVPSSDVESAPPLAPASLPVIPAPGPEPRPDIAPLSLAAAPTPVRSPARDPALEDILSNMTCLCGADQPAAILPAAVPARDDRDRGFPRERATAGDAIGSGATKERASPTLYDFRNVATNFTYDSGVRDRAAPDGEQDRRAWYASGCDGGGCYPVPTSEEWERRNEDLRRKAAFRLR